MYDFALSMWRQGRVTIEQISTLVARGKLTQQQADTIMATPQV